MPDGAQHVAFAYSANGKDRFTNVYPNLNLSNNTRLNYDILPTNISEGSGTDRSEKVPITDLPGISWGRKYTPSTRAASTGMRVANDVGDLKSGDTVTESFWVKNIGNRPIRFQPSMGFRYGTETEPNDGVPTGWAYSEGNDVEVKNDGKWTKVPFTATIPGPTAAPNRTGDTLKSVVNYAYTSNKNQPLTATDQFILSPVKLEKGSTATPYMPSASEATASDYPSHIGTYTDNNSNEQSTDPARYSWKKIE